jgi:adenylate kinase
MKTGNLLPDEIVGKELIDYLKKLTKHSDPRGYIFDGYPRNLQQKAIFEEICRINNISLEYVFFLNVAEKILRERIKERSKSSGRSDDKNEEAFQIRMDEYNEQTLPMIESMRNGGGFLEISGENKLDDITKLIFNKINEI